MGRSVTIALILLALLGATTVQHPVAADVCERNPALCR